jgi:APA family basic amino acid/polyamine antiporter
LTLEYGISAAAVARNWGDKLYIYMTLPYTEVAADGSVTEVHHSFPAFLDPENNGGLNLFAGALQLICVIVLMQGLDVSKITINFFTIFKLVLVAFMIVMGFSRFDSANLAPFAPMGMLGIMKGATSCIFGLLGYDEVRHLLVVITESIIMQFACSAGVLLSC